MKISQLLGMTLREGVEVHAVKGYELLLRAAYLRHHPLGSVLLTPGKVLIDSLAQALCKHIHADDANRLHILFSPLASAHAQDWAEILGGEVQSYRDLPKLFTAIQDQAKRDTAKSKWPKLSSASQLQLQFWAKDQEEAQQWYEETAQGIQQFFQALGLENRLAHAFPDGQGGAQGQAWVWEHALASEQVLADQEWSLADTAKFARESLPASDAAMEKIFTPGSKTIQDLAEFTKLAPSQMAKAVFLSAEHRNWNQAQLVLALVRGDREANLEAIKALVGAESLVPAEEAQILSAGCVPGYASAVGVDPKKVWVIADTEISEEACLLAGANEADYHLLNTQLGRDYQVKFRGEIAMATEGAAGISGSTLQAHSVLSLGTIRRVGALEGVNFNDIQGRPQPITAVEVSINLTQLLISLAEVHHDEQGLHWPLALAPYQLQMVSLADHAEVIALADNVYADLSALGIKVLYDDRAKKAAGPGIKFKDADLRGIPLRLTLAKRGVQQGEVEVKLRAGGEMEKIPIANIQTVIQEKLRALQTP